MGLRQIQRLMPGEHGDLQFVGTSAASDAGVVARWQDSRLEVVATSPQTVHAWRGLEDSLWVLERTSLRSISAGNQQRTDRAVR
jgi:hypothetical protein